MSENPPAFPQNEFSAYTTDRTGMTLRDYYVGQAIVGLLSSGKWSNCGEGFADYIAVEAGNIADALLTEREGGGE